LIPVPTLALATLDIKHLFDAPQKCRTPGVEQNRTSIRSNYSRIEL
jgi:hypothetical protein